MKDTSLYDSYLQFGVDYQKRRIHFGNPALETDVDETSVSIAMRALEKMKDLKSGTAKTADIELHLATYGGDVYMGMALYDKIMETPCRIRFFGRGPIMSMGAWIMCACDERSVSENSTILLHEGSTDNGVNTVTGSAIDAEESTRLNELLAAILAKRTFVDSVGFWLGMMQKDLYITPKEALLLGLVDSVVPHIKRGRFRQGATLRSKKEKPTKKQLSQVIKKLRKRVHDLDVRAIDIRVPVDEEQEIEEIDNTGSAEAKVLGVPEQTPQAGKEKADETEDR